MSNTTGNTLLDHRLRGPSPPGEVVLLLNGGMMTHAAWEPVTRQLLDSYAVLGCDFRGQLGSPGAGLPGAGLPGAGQSELHHHVEDLIALLEELQIGPVHVLGTSFGGEVGVLLAARHASRVRSLALVTAADRTPPGMAEDARHMADLARQVMAGGEPGPFHDALVRDVYSAGYRKSHAAELEERRQRRLPDAWYEGLLGILATIEDFDLSEDLGRIACPTLVVHAAHDAVMPEPRVRALAEGIADAELRVHPDSGHALVFEDPAWLVDVYRDFLDRRTNPPPQTRAGRR